MIMKRMLLVLLMVLILFSAFAHFNAFAVSTPVFFSVSNASNLVGNNVDLRVYASDTSSIGALKMVLFYDTSKLDIISVKNGTIITIVNPSMQYRIDETNGTITLIYLSFNTRKVNGSIIDCTFRIKEGIETQHIPVTLNVIELYNFNEEIVPYTINNGVVTAINNPFAPLNVRETNNAGTSVNLKWDSSATATGYNIYKNGIKINTAPVELNEYTVTGLLEETTYIFTVRTVNIFGESEDSQALLITTKDITAPIITGVTENKIYTSEVTIAFDEGIATLNGNYFENGETVSLEGRYTLVVTDEANNSKMVNFSVFYPVRVTGYLLKDTVISDIQPGLSVNSFVSGLTISGETTILVNDAKGNFKSLILNGSSRTVIDGQNKIGTGTKVIVYISGQEVSNYTTVVSGDVNGDEEVNTLDLIKVKNTLLNKQSLEGVFLQAADSNRDNKISILDLLELKERL